ncbi:MAG TPA: protein-tyrosine phosphatase family protein [Gemmataceae bacterium]|nr:protein-tyrosine phosphatase family protein [Gemmataceae bacterium]
MQATAYWVEGPWRGRLAVLPRPRGGDWLEDEARAWKSAGVDVVVSLLEKEEAEEFDITAEEDACRKNGVEFVSHPITDRGLPPSPRAFADLVRALEEKLAAGKGVGVHCRQGVGRSALLAACLLIGAGVDGESAWRRVAAARGRSVPDTTEQREWAVRFGREFLAGPPKK